MVVNHTHSPHLHGYQDDSDAVPRSHDHPVYTQALHALTQRAPIPAATPHEPLSDSDCAWRRTPHRYHSSTSNHRRSHRSPSPKRSRRGSHSSRHHRSPPPKRSRQGSHSSHHHHHHHKHRHSMRRTWDHSPYCHRPHFSHHHLSILDRLGSTSPPDSDSYHYTDDVLPSSCGQPIPQSLIRHIRRGEYINFSLLLPSSPGLDPDATNHKSPWSSSPVTDRNITSSQELKATLPKVTNLDSWLCAWSKYLLAVIHFFPQKVREMIQYQDRIITAAERYSFEGWYNYDKAFCLKLSQDPSQWWDCLDADLWSSLLKFVPTALAAIAMVTAGYMVLSEHKDKGQPTICLRFNTTTCPSANLLMSASSVKVHTPHHRVIVTAPLDQHKPTTPIDASQLEIELSSHPDKHWTSQILHNLTQGSQHWFRRRLQSTHCHQP